VRVINFRIIIIIIIIIKTVARVEVNVSLAFLHWVRG